MDIADRLISTAQAAGMLQVSVRTVQRLTTAGDLPHVHKLPATGGYLFDRLAVEAYRAKAAV